MVQPQHKAMDVPSPSQRDLVIASLLKCADLAKKVKA